MDAGAGQQALSTPSSLNKGLNNTMKRKRAVVPKKTPNTNIPVRQNMICTYIKLTPFLNFNNINVPNYLLFIDIYIKFRKW